MPSMAHPALGTSRAVIATPVQSLYLSGLSLLPQLLCVNRILPSIFMRRLLVCARHCFWIVTV